MVLLENLLACAGFSQNFRESVVDLGHGYMALLDEPNLLRFVLEDFTKQLKDHVSLNYTNLTMQSLKDSDLEQEQMDYKTCTIGVGLHKHPEKNLYLCCEAVTGDTMVNTGVHRFTTRSALITVESMTVINSYVESLQKQNQEEKKLKRYLLNSSDFEWIQDKIDLRTPETLFLGKLWTDLANDAKDFLTPETKEFYRQRGIPYVRSYLFHGHPGNGKSACIKTLASTLNINLYCLNLTISRMDDMSLLSAIHDVRKNSIVAIEDIDRVFDHFSANQSASSVSFSTFINILDGIFSKDGLIFILTCNDQKKMEEALVRSGRIDKSFEFPDASDKILDKMYISFYPGEEKHAEKFKSELKDLHGVPVATVQEFFLKNRKRKSSEIIQDVNPNLFRSRRKISSMSN